MAENLFDEYQDMAFDVVLETMGYDASWTPSQGGETENCRVLFNNPTEKQKHSVGDYDPYRWEMEYKDGNLSGLKASVDAGGEEVITLKGQQYYVRQVLAKHDGKTFVATMEPKSSE